MATVAHAPALVKTPYFAARTMAAMPMPTPTGIFVIRIHISSVRIWPRATEYPMGAKQVILVAQGDLVPASGNARATEELPEPREAGLDDDAYLTVEPAINFVGHGLTSSYPYTSS